MSLAPWSEWDGDSPPVLIPSPDTAVFYMLGHPDAVEVVRDSLVLELAQSGVADTVSVAYAQAAHAVLSYGWFGFVDGAISASWCDGSGFTVGEDLVERAIPCVYALVRR